MMMVSTITRVTDKKHHVTDVLAGGLLGLLFAGAAFALLAEQRCLDVGGPVEEPELLQHEGHVGGVTGQTLPGPEEEVQPRLKQSGEEENLEVQDWLGAGREVRLAWNNRKSCNVVLEI